MKNVRLIAMLAVFSGLFFTSCEKEYFTNPLPGNSGQGVLKDGEEGDDTGDDVGDEDGDGITDGGRDEDYDKSGNKKKPKQ